MKKIPPFILFFFALLILLSFKRENKSKLDDKLELKATGKTAPFNIIIPGLQTHKFIPPKAPGSGGDNDFGGHGPKVNVKVELFVKGKFALWARVTMIAQEIGGDGSMAMGSKEELLYIAGLTNEILSINTPTVSEFVFADDDHSDDYVGGNGRVKAGDAHAYWNPNPSFIKADNAVAFCVVTADTDGQEIGSRTGVRVFFNPVSITVKNPAPDLSQSFSLNAAGVGSCGESTCSASSGAGLLHYYGFNSVTCDEFWRKETSVGHFVNWVRDNHIANMGIPPNVLRDKLKEWKNDVQLRNLNASNYFAEIQNILRVQRRPVIALVSWGSRAVKDYYVPNDDSYGFSNAIVHYVLIDGWDRGPKGNESYWHVIDNGEKKKWSDEYFRNAFFWRPENFIVEGVLYPQDVHPGNIVY
jgi:hypothetical protein